MPLYHFLNPFRIPKDDKIKRQRRTSQSKYEDQMPKSSTGENAAKYPYSDGNMSLRTQHDKLGILLLFRGTN